MKKLINKIVIYLYFKLNNHRGLVFYDDAMQELEKAKDRIEDSGIVISQNTFNTVQAKSLNLFICYKTIDIERIKMNMHQSEKHIKELLSFYKNCCEGLEKIQKEVEEAKQELKNIIESGKDEIRS